MRELLPVSLATLAIAAPQGSVRSSTIEGDYEVLGGIVGGAGPPGKRDASRNHWFNPDGALGAAPAQMVPNDGLSVFGPQRWVSQNVTLTPYVSTFRTTSTNGSTAVRVLNGYTAEGFNTINKGTKRLAVATGLNLVPGVPVQAVCSDLSKSISGVIIGYKGSEVALRITSTSGTGSCTTWVIGRDGRTQQAQTKLNASAASAPGSLSLTFPSTSGVQIGSAVESRLGYNGIPRGAYVVRKTSTTITMSNPVTSQIDSAHPVRGVQKGQEITFYGDQGVFLYQDILSSEGRNFHYGTPAAHDARFSFDVQGFGAAGTASIMFLGYSSTHTLGRALVLDFPVSARRTRIGLRIPGDTVGALGVWGSGYGGKNSGGLWGALGFSWESQGTATSANIRPGSWQDATPGHPAFATGGSANQTFDLTHTVGAWVEVSNVLLELTPGGRP